MREAEARLTALRQHLEEKQRRESESEEQCAGQAQKLTDLEEQVSRLSSSLVAEQTRIAELETEKKTLQADLARIMGNLTRW
ncbi:MAG: hypothetical protein WDA75_21300 [Candidatus Latescibacterota bacterium]